MKEKARYGFMGTMGLLIMICSGTFMAAFALYIVIKMMNGLSGEQSLPMFGTLFLGGVLPYATGRSLFWWGKRIKGRGRAH